MEIETATKNKTGITTDKFICIYTADEPDLRHLNAAKADVPERNKVYTLKKLFFHVAYRIKDCSYAMHFEELNHGDLIGYKAKYFKPVDELGNIIPSDKVFLQLSEEENPTWKLIDNRIIVAAD